MKITDYLKWLVRNTNHGVIRRGRVFLTRRNSEDEPLPGGEEEMHDCCACPQIKIINYELLSYLNSPPP